MESKPIAMSDFRPPRRPQNGDRWGRWVYRTEPWATLVYEMDGMEQYYVHITDCLTHEKRCGWLAQLAEKRWISDEDLGRFVRALDALVGWR